MSPPFPQDRTLTVHRCWAVQFLPKLRTEVHRVAKLSDADAGCGQRVKDLCLQFVDNRDHMASERQRGWGHRSSEEPEWLCVYCNALAWGLRADIRTYPKCTIISISCWHVREQTASNNASRGVDASCCDCYFNSPRCVPTDPALALSALRVQLRRPQSLHHRHLPAANGQQRSHSQPRNPASASKRLKQNSRATSPNRKRWYSFTSASTNQSSRHVLFAGSATPRGPRRTSRYTSRIALACRRAWSGVRRRTKRVMGSPSQRWRVGRSSRMGRWGGLLRSQGTSGVRWEQKSVNCILLQGAWLNNDYLALSTPAHHKSMLIFARNNQVHTPVVQSLSLPSPTRGNKQARTHHRLRHCAAHRNRHGCDKSDHQRLAERSGRA